MNELVTMNDLDEENLAKIAAMIGQADTGGSSNAGFPRLAIEQQNENMAGDTLPKGSFRLRSGDSNVYSKELELRMFVRHYSYDLWNNENPELSVRSVMASSLSDDFPDTSGGYKCGKLSKDDIAKLPNNSIEHARQKSIKCTQVIYGVITASPGAATLDGQEVDLKDTPFVWAARGSAFIPVSNYIREVPPGKLVLGQKATVSTKRHTNGGVVYYTPVFDKPKSVKIGQDDIDLLNTFMEDIKKYNERILKEFTERKDSVLAREDLEVADSLEVA
jgi:hypothetical protein